MLLFTEEQDRREQQVRELEELVEEIRDLGGETEGLEFFSIEDLDEFLEGLTPTEIIHKAHFGRYVAQADYFQFDGYGNLETFTQNEYEQEMLALEDEIREEYKALTE